MAYKDIGGRNHDAVIRNGKKVIDKLNQQDSYTAKAIALQYGWLLDRLELLHQAANELINRSD